MNTLKYMWETIKFQPLYYTLVWFFSFTFFITPLIAALIVREIFNILEGATNLIVDIWWLVIIYVVVNLLQLFLDVAWAIIQYIFFLSARLLFRKNMLNGVLNHQPGAASLPYSSGESISRFRRDADEAAYFPIAIADLVNFIIFGIIALTLMFTINVEVTTFVFLPFTVVVVITNLYRKKLMYYRDRSRKAAGVVTSTINEMFNSAQSIKVENAETNVLKNFEKVNKKRGDASIQDEFLNAALGGFRSLIVFLATGMMFLIIIDPMINDTFTIGDFALFTFLLGWVTATISYIGETIARYHRTKISFKRMIQMMKGEQKEIDDEAILKHGPIYIKEEYPEILRPQYDEEDNLENLNIKNLSYTYPDSSKGIQAINFTLEKNTLTVITGKVGSGKSTLLKTLLGLLPKTTGTIYWNGKAIDDEATFFVPPRSAYTAQIPHLFSDSIKANLLFGYPEDVVKIDEALSHASVKDEIYEFKDQLNTFIGPKGVKLSGGQRQRLAAARMLIREPQLIVFDDLSSALDIETEKELWNQLFSNNMGTYLIVSHRSMVLQQADNIILLKDGEIEAQGTLSELLDQSKEMRRLYEDKGFNETK